MKLNSYDVPQEYWGMFDLLYQFSLNHVADECYFLESGVHINAYSITYEGKPSWIAIEPNGFANVFSNADYKDWKNINMAIPFLDF